MNSIHSIPNKFKESREAYITAHHCLQPKNSAIFEPYAVCLETVSFHFS